MEIGKTSAGLALVIVTGFALAGCGASTSAVSKDRAAGGNDAEAWIHQAEIPKGCQARAQMLDRYGYVRLLARCRLPARPVWLDFGQTIIDMVGAPHHRVITPASSVIGRVLREEEVVGLCRSPNHYIQGKLEGERFGVSCRPVSGKKRFPRKFVVRVMTRVRPPISGYQWGFSASYPRPIISVGVSASVKWVDCSREE